MGIHSKQLIANLQSQLDERMDNLKKVMEGRKPQSFEVADYPEPDIYAKVSASNIRIAVDDFSTILREIKRVLK